MKKIIQATAAVTLVSGICIIGNCKEEIVKIEENISISKENIDVFDERVMDFEQKMVNFNKKTAEIDNKIEILSNEKKSETETEIDTKNEVKNEENENESNNENNNQDIKKQSRMTTTEDSSNVDFELTFYTSLPCENGGFETTAIQTELRHGVVASNYYDIGTEIKIGDMIFTVEDRGGSEFDSPNRLDVLVERKEGESDEEYQQRVMELGRIQVEGTIIGG